MASSELTPMLEGNRSMDTKMMNPSQRKRAVGIGGFLALLLFVAAASASAETLLMPNRDVLMGASEVVWGVTTLTNGTSTYTIEFGDGSPNATGTVTDRSYIAVLHTFATSGTFTVKLTVVDGATTEVGTTVVRSFDASLISASDLRGLNINRTIQDGLRWLWTAQTNRAANFPLGDKTSWRGTGGGGDDHAFSSLVVLAFENHGYHVPSTDAPATGLYEKYIVQRGLNFVADQFFQQALNVQTAGDPCVGGVGPAPCVGLYNNEQPGYGTAIAALPLAASTALGRHVPAGIGANNAFFVAGKTLGEVLQRVMNTVAWGQNDGTCVGRGGWIYGFSSGFCQQSDGSTVGWDVFALLDAAAVGIVEPAFVKAEFDGFALPQGLNNATAGVYDGTFDYRADNNPASSNLPNVARAGIGGQGLFYVGAAGGDSRVAAAKAFIASRWGGLTPGGDYTGTCGFNFQNKGCAYAMLNVFKFLKLYGVTTLSGVGDWYADYQDFLVANQTDTSTAASTDAGGSWSGGAGKIAMSFSCCDNANEANAAIAELILSPVALVAPDPTKFSTVGLSPKTATNPPGTSHTVTAKAESASGAPVPGVTIDFKVITGPNAGKTGSDITDANGEATFTYLDTSSPPYPKTDEIQAYIGTTLSSNVVTKTWATSSTKCDADADGDVDSDDLALIRAANGMKKVPATDPRDGNGDGKITVADVRYCTLRCTRASCATEEEVASGPNVQ